LFTIIATHVFQDPAFHKTLRYYIWSKLREDDTYRPKYLDPEDYRTYVQDLITGVWNSDLTRPTQKAIADMANLRLTVSTFDEEKESFQHSVFGHGDPIHILQLTDTKYLHVK
jgi:hypothetical protein